MHIKNKTSKANYLKSSIKCAKTSAFALLISATLSGCAMFGATEEQVFDPLEPLNRTVFAVNETVDVLALTPASTIYNGLMPDFFRNSVTNFLRNLSSPITVANQVLQGDWEGTQTTAARFFINSTIGLAGVLDPATEQGYAYEDEDFGQTLAVWGIPEGPYLVLPLIGPSNFRDTTGLVADSVADPLNLYLNSQDLEELIWARAAASAFSSRAAANTAVTDMRANSVDFYAASRSAYHQRREALIRDNNDSDIEIPEYKDE